MRVSLHFSLVGEIAETARANDRLADGVRFVRRDFLRPLPLNRAVNVNFAARFFADVIDGDNHRGVIIIFALESGLDGIGQLLATPARGLDETDVRNFQLAAVVDAQTLGFVVAILDDAEADVIVRARASSCRRALPWNWFA